MSLRVTNNSRKRRRSIAFPDDENGVEEEMAEDHPGEDTTIQVDELNLPADVAVADTEQGVDGEDAREKSEKEQALWESFREEHYEIFEQLPLSLHRAYQLINELDGQVNTGNAKMLQQVQNYVGIRRALGSQPVENQGTPTEVPMQIDHVPTTSSSRSEANLAPSPHKVQSTRDSPLHSVSETNRAIISGLARLSEDIMSAANEKLNVSRFACEIIDRSIRELEREMKEQETSLSLGLRPGTHPATIVLPEVVLPKPSRITRIQESPVYEEPPIPLPEIQEAEPVLEESPVVDTPVEDNTNAPGPQPMPKRKPRRNRGWSRKKSDHKEREKDKEKEKEKEKEKDNDNEKGKEQEAELPKGEEDVPELPPAAAVLPGSQATPVPEAVKPPAEIESDRPATRLTVTLPPLASIQQANALPDPTPEEIDPNEERFCYCNGISYGYMVGCDGCDGWFHFEHIGEQTIPRGKWYCRDCAPTKGQGRPRAKHTRKRK